MRIVTFNVNGLRAVLDKDENGARGTKNPNVLQSIIDKHDPDVLCLQETKCPENLSVDLPFAYKKILASKTRKGYSGVAVLSKHAPSKVHDDFPLNEEGRLICLEFDHFYLVNAYVPNSKPDLSRLDYRENVWEPAVRSYLGKLQKMKNIPVVFAADFNVAPTAADLHDPVKNKRSHGFTEEERTAFAALLDQCDIVDSYRVLHPKARNEYTWFSNFAKSRERNKGWRIDTILVSARLAPKLKKAEILKSFKGSDHVPFMIDFQ